MGIKRLFDTKHINYTKKIIIQASDLKKDLESLNLKRFDTTIVSLNNVNMYP